MPFLPAYKGNIAQIAVFQKLKSFFAVSAFHTLKEIAEFTKSGEVHFKISLPSVVHNPTVQRTPVVGRIICAKGDGMVAHVALIQKRRIRRSHKIALLGRAKDRTVIRNIVFLAGSGKLVNPRPHCRSALGYKALGLRQIK